MEEKELQEKIILYKMIEAKIEGLLKQREALIAKSIELDNTIEGIEEVEKSEEENLFSIGSETYFFGRITDKKRVIVEVGADIALEKSFEEAKGILRKRKNDVENAVREIEKNIVQLSAGLQAIGLEINELIASKKG